MVRRDDFLVGPREKAVGAVKAGKTEEALAHLNDVYEQFHRLHERLSENAHLPRYPHPSSLRRTSMYASFLGISEALHLDIFHQPLRSRFFDSF